jgi:hypothetical protein
MAAPQVLAAVLLALPLVALAEDSHNFESST